MAWTNRKLIRKCNALARTFYKMQGYEVPKSFKLYESTHPHEQGCWNMAVAAYEHIKGVDVDDALEEMLDDEQA